MHDFIGTPMSISVICDLLWEFPNSGNHSLSANLENLPFKAMYGIYRDIGRRILGNSEELDQTWELP